ncbi:MAG: 2-amino-4-hydroxy-6-hydroxymethyldihydropteridine diphosphokinase [Desulfobacterales bacterium]|nr:2-amino-4-hydroxy-6-hydroxymethyldihydropteridine diphosphokinase [Desulfobacterales bacterium]
MTTAYIGIGSNLGDKLNNCRKSIEMTGRIPDTSVTAQSVFYRTEPVGVEGQDWYVNGVISLSTGLSAQDLLKNLLDIEQIMGRERKKKWDSRTIDLDILLYGQEVIEEEDLTVPHPLMHLRRFVLEPMVQLAPDLIHPVLGKSMAGLLEDFREQGQDVIPLGEA